MKYLGVQYYISLLSAAAHGGGQATTPAWLSQAEIKGRNPKKSNYEYNKEWISYEEKGGTGIKLQIWMKKENEN